MDGAEIAVIRKHYYTPLVDDTDLRSPLHQERSLPGIDLNEDGQVTLLRQFNYQHELAKFPSKRESPLHYAYENGLYEAGDADFLYCMVRHFRPAKVLEVGSGNSTLVVDAALKQNRREHPEHNTRHICIEPFEQPWLEQLGPEIKRSKVETCDPEVFAALKANDILFIDSSHVIRPQGDVLFLFQSILPSLAPGVIVHVHDVFTPRDYPHEWVIERRKLWNEQYLLEAFLTMNTEFEVLGALNWLKHHHRALLEQAFPAVARYPDQEPGAFWFRRRTPLT